MRHLSIIASLTAFSCSEYNIGDKVPPFGEANPPGLDNPINTDKIVQVTTPAVDVLWVLDNSGSMYDNQQALANNFPTFMEYFLGSGLDYHIGLVSTDMASPAHKGKLVEAQGVRFITTETDEPMLVFSQMAQLGTGGSSNEQGRAPAYAALEELKDGYNEGFLRDDLTAGVHVVLVSDEEDYTPNNGNAITKDEFVDYMNTLRPLDELVTFNSICTPPNVPIDGGDNYVYLTDRIGGILHDIRVNDWINVLEALGIQAAGLKREYFLSQLPVVDTISVQVHMTDGNVVPFENDQYAYSGERNSITFDDFVPDPLSQVYIQYTVLASMVDGVDAE